MIKLLDSLLPAPSWSLCHEDYLKWLYQCCHVGLITEAEYKFNCTRPFNKYHAEGRVWRVIFGDLISEAVL